MPEPLTERSPMEIADALLNGEEVSTQGALHDDSPASQAVDRISKALLEDSASPEVAAETVVEQQAAAVETPEAAPVVEQEGQELASNWRLKFDNIEDRQVAALVKSGVSMREASARVYGFDQPQTAVATTQEYQAQPEVSEVLAAKEARLAEIENALDTEVEGAGDVGITLTKEIRALQKEQAQLMREIPQLEREAESLQNSAFDADQVAYEQSERDAEDAFPALKDPSSELYKAVSREAASVVADPTNPLSMLPDRAFLLAARVAKKIGYKAPVASPASTAAEHQAAPTTVTKTAQVETPPAFRSVSGAAASDAPRVVVGSQHASPMDAYKQSASKGDGGFKSIMAGIDALLDSSSAGSAARDPRLIA